MASARVPRRGVPGAVPLAVRRGRAAGAVPRAQAAGSRAGAEARLGRGARAPGHYEAVLRPLHPRDRDERLRSAPGPPGQGARFRGCLSRVRRPGALALVLHTHMPYVEGFGTWPFGEEWLWEAIATSYEPLLDVLGDEQPVTLSVTPVLADVRPRTHAEDIATATEPGVAAALERSAADYDHAVRRLAELGDRGLLDALGAHADWTSAATHAVLPLLATDAGARLQLETGVASHRRRFGEWRGGLWLPECAYAPWLDPLLVEAGAEAVCVDFTDVFGYGAPEHLRPLRSAGGLTLVPIDRAMVELVWSDDGYPAHAAYRNYHGLTANHHRGWSNDGRGYDQERARERASADAADFVDRVAARVRDGGLCVCALDTELLGHWWYEGPVWLREVLDRARRVGLPVVRLDDALARHAPTGAPADLPVTSWGRPRDLSTWSGPPVADLAWSLRTAELAVVAAADRVDVGAVRELLGAQASDWAFQVTRALAGDYPRQRAEGHRARLVARLAGAAADDAALRHLAPDATPASLRVP